MLKTVPKQGFSEMGSNPNVVVRLYLEYLFFLYIILLYYILFRYFSGYTVEAGQLMGGSASPSTCELVKMLQRAMKMKAPSAYRHTQLP